MRFIWIWSTCFRPNHRANETIKQLYFILVCFADIITGKKSLGLTMYSDTYIDHHYRQHTGQNAMHPCKYFYNNYCIYIYIQSHPALPTGTQQAHVDLSTPLPLAVT